MISSKTRDFLFKAIDIDRICWPVMGKLSRGISMRPFDEDIKAIESEISYWLAIGLAKKYGRPGSQ